MDPETSLIVFQEKEIRRLWHNEGWFFSIIDVVAVLTGSSIPRRYWSDLKIKLKKEGFELYEKIVQLKLPSSDEGGAVAGRARKDLETKSGRRVVTSENYVEQPEAVKRLEKKK